MTELIPAKASDLEEIMGMVADAQAYLGSRGVDQWQNGYPTREIILSDIERGAGRLLREGAEAIGYEAVTPGPEPCYARIDGGRWLTEADDYAVVHRSCVAARARSSGNGERLLRLAEDAARELGAHSLRADTHAENSVMRSLLEKLGYTYCGVIYLIGTAENGDPRVAYEKRL